jgi:PiT family inorganic phosphate transporter
MGTALGGWRIVKTMGMRLTKLKPMGGFSAETSGACSLFLATLFGIPVSTTHTITAAILGVASLTTTYSNMRWGMVFSIIWAWILTLPGSALIGASLFYLIWENPST